MVMVKKKGGELRFSCDFRPLNEATVKGAYPLPRTDESLSCLGKCFSSLDGASVFWQLPLWRGHRDITAFGCELGLFEWKRMPFGLWNATVTFQRPMAKALAASVEQREWSLVMCFVDDEIIARDTIQEHVVRFREVIACLQDAGRTNVISCRKKPNNWDVSLHLTV